MKKTLRILLALIIVLLVVVIFKTITFQSIQIEVEPVTPPVFRNESVANLSKAITFPTISHEIDLPIDSLVFLEFHQFIAETYPLIHSELKKEVFSEFSLLYTWEGKDASLKPVILMAHMDVVPAAETDAWEKPPFSGENDGTFIWGRGTLDDKGSMIAILEAAERLLSEDYRPERTIYLAFGHDEEINGLRGARVIASALKERGVEAEFILDEGLAILKGIVPMISKPVATIGTSEKGYLSVTLTVEMEGGHSSTPEKETSITVLNKALHSIINKQTKAGISAPLKDFIRYIGPEMPFYMRAIFANQWLFKGIIVNIYEGSNAGNATVRTTTAPTIINAGLKDNVIPTKAEAVVNFRIIPGETSADVIRHLQKVIADDRVNISVVGQAEEPTPVSPVNVSGFEIISKTIQQVYPEVILSPMLVVGQTDSRHYTDVSRNIYRFVPVVVNRKDLARMHGLNERISIDDFIRSIGFYYQLIKNTD